ncbi:MAG: TIGR02587 family membrane protein [Actinomycetota bacterium]|nr:TIGR02587 family membrane protein [Actinomycetota bacterium]
MSSSSKTGSWRREYADFARAFSGAFLFGIALLYTMEMWWIGTYIAPSRLLVLLALAFAANLALTHFAGFKKGHSLGRTVNQATDSVAVGVVASLVILLVLNRIGLSDPLDAILGQIVIQAVPLSIGASLANAVFSSGGREGGGGEGKEARPVRSILKDMGATAVGATFVGSTVAPTVEIPLLAAELGRLHELALIAVSLIISYMIVFASGFTTQPKPREDRSLLQRPVPETLLAYVVSLLVALVALYLFDRVEIGDPVGQVVSGTLVLGLPAAVGGAAGRVAV